MSFSFSSPRIKLPRSSLMFSSAFGGKTKNQSTKPQAFPTSLNALYSCILTQMQSTRQFKQVGCYPLSVSMEMSIRPVKTKHMLYSNHYMVII